MTTKESESQAATVSIVLTVNNRSPEVSRAVAESLKLPGNRPDELVVVLDRPDMETRGGAVAAYSSLDLPTKYVDVPGDPGWLGPARAWNAGFAAATGDLYYLISSETTQSAGNVKKARAACELGNLAVFGACTNSEPVSLVMGAEPGFLAGSKLPRPLGFIVCLPADKIREVGGFDEAFMKGLWYEDDDLFLRLWKTGLDFLFWDEISGIHLDHPRPDLETPEGQEKIARNAALMTKKHGTHQPWQNLLKIEARQEGKTTWSHV